MSHPPQSHVEDLLQAAVSLPRLRAIELAAWPSNNPLAPTTSSGGEPTDAPTVASDQDEERWSQALHVELGEAADPYVPNAPDAPLVRRLEEEAGPRPIAQFYADIVSRSADGIAMRARHRARCPMEERAHEEESILELTDALIATGPGCLLALSAWFDEAVSSPDPWKVWTPVFVLGTLSGEEPLRAIEEVLAMLPDDAVSQAEVAAEALRLSTHPDLDRFARRLLGSSQGSSVAVGIDVLSRRGGLETPELARLLQDPRASVACAAAAAAPRLPDPAALLEPLAMLLRAEDARVVQRAARACVLLGDSAPYRELYDRTPLATTLGAEAIELFVLCGDEKDMVAVNRILASTVATAELLAAVGRLGHARTWSFLLRHLTDEDLAEHAALALRTLFGDKVSEDDEMHTQAWIDAIDSAKIDPDVRYRRGAPWRPRVVADECRSGALSRMEVALRLDELAVRTGLRASFDLAGWAPHVDAALSTYLAQIERHDAEYPTGSWRHAARALVRVQSPYRPGSITARAAADTGRAPGSLFADSPRSGRRVIAPAPPSAIHVKEVPPSHSEGPSSDRGPDTAPPLRAPQRAVLPFAPFAVREAQPPGPPLPAAHAQPRPAVPVAPPAGPSRLTLEQYASLCAELAVFSARREEVFARYGLKDQGQRTSIDTLWKGYLRENPALKHEWERYYRHYHAHWTEMARRTVR